MQKQSRRDFLIGGACALGAIAVGSAAIPKNLRRSEVSAVTYTAVGDGPIELSMEEVRHQMVDGLASYQWGYRGPDGLMRIPGPVIFAYEGDTVRVNVANNFPAGHIGVHGFSIPGVVDSGPIAQGQRGEISFVAPAPGTYMYLDPMNAPVNRVMGLAGVLVVMPLDSSMPYLNPPASVTGLFNDLGTTGWTPGRGSDYFPGHPWDPERQWVWVFNTVDPVMNLAVRDNPLISPELFVADYLPLYFTFNGRSGQFSSHGMDIEPHGNIGQPALIRNVNMGLAHHSPHIHGNHVLVLAENNITGRSDLATADLTEEESLPLNGNVHENVLYVDTWGMAPGDRKDLLLPFSIPPDVIRDRPINRDPAQSPTGRASVLSAAERVARGGNNTPWPPVEEPFPLLFPMHCHVEMSQTAAGNNYPHGLITHWAVEGDIDMYHVLDLRGTLRRQINAVQPGLNAVILVTEADLRIKFNRLHIKGVFSGLPGSVIELFGAAAVDPAHKIGEATVDIDGRWVYRGSAGDATAASAVSLRAMPHPSFSAEAAAHFSCERNGVRVDMR